MKRYNTFYQIHKGLRALMYETALLIQRADFCTEAECQYVKQQVQTLVALFEKHAASEDHHVFAAVKTYEPSVADAFEQEHMKDHALGIKLQTALDELDKAGDKTEAGNTLSNVFTEFMVFNLAHMAREEEVINTLLWRYYSDGDLHNLTLQIVAGIAPDQLLLYNKWMMRGLSIPEICGWLQEVKNNAPAFVFAALMKTAEDELSSGGKLQVAEALTEGAMLA